MATPRMLTSSPNETRKVHEGLPASEEPVGKGSTTEASPEEGASCPEESSRRSPEKKLYKHTAHRTTFHGETGPAKNMKELARSFKCMACDKSFIKKSKLLVHQRSHATWKGSVGLEHGPIFGQRGRLPIYTAAHLLKVTHNVKLHVRKQSAEGTYRCQKCMETFLLHENFLKHQKTHLPPEPGQPQAGNLCMNQKGGQEDAGGNHPEFLREEVTKIRQNFDLLLFNQQVQHQVLQGIQKQLDIVLPGDDLINSNVYRLGLMLSQQTAAIKSLSVPFFLGPRDQLPEHNPDFSF